MYPLAFNEFQKYQIKEDYIGVIAITDMQNTQRTGQFESSNCMIQNCAMIKDDLYLITKDQKMIVIQKLDQKIIEVEGENSSSSDFETTVPHSNSTPFVVQDVLFIVGGHDRNYEPFSDIFQLNHDTLSWQMYGRTTVSRYGARVVVFKGKNEKEFVFIAGGFKQKDLPCSVVEIIPIEVTYS